MNKAVTYREAAIHEAGHVIVTLGTGCLLYSCTVGCNSTCPDSMGYVRRGTQTDRQSTVIGMAGAMSEWLIASDRKFIMTEFLDLFATDFKYGSDRNNCGDYSWADAAWESRRILLRRRGHLERLIGHLSRPENQNRKVDAVELFQMSGCRLLNSRKLPVAKRLVQARLTRYSDVGYHQWLAIDSKRS